MPPNSSGRAQTAAAQVARCPQAAELSSRVKLINGPADMQFVRRRVAERWLESGRAKYVACVDGVDQIHLLEKIREKESHPYDLVRGSWQWQKRNSGGVEVMQAEHCGV